VLLCSVSDLPALRGPPRIQQGWVITVKNEVLSTDGRIMFIVQLYRVLLCSSLFLFGNEARSLLTEGYPLARS